MTNKLTISHAPNTVSIVLPSIPFFVTLISPSTVGITELQSPYLVPNRGALRCCTHARTHNRVKKLYNNKPALFHKNPKEAQ